MTPEEKAAKDMLFIAPYDYEGLAGWLVRISWYPDANYENRKWHSKLFAFRDFASIDDALAAARSYRDKWIEENKGKRYLRSIGARFSPTLPRNNTSGIVGVNRSEKRKKSAAAVFTLKAMTDLNYLACAHRLVAQPRQPLLLLWRGLGDTLQVLVVEVAGQDDLAGRQDRGALQPRQGAL